MTSSERYPIKSILKNLICKNRKPAVHLFESSKTKTTVVFPLIGLHHPLHKSLEKAVNIDFQRPFINLLLTKRWMIGHCVYLLVVDKGLHHHRRYI